MCKAIRNGVNGWIFDCIKAHNDFPFQLIAMHLTLANKKESFEKHRHRIYIIDFIMYMNI